MKKIGIDLGTTNSLVAYWTANGPEIIPNVLGSNLTPSVVSVDENGEILVGQVAKERLITHPQLTASAFKRFMGTEKKYQLGKYIFTPEELSSFVLRSLKGDAEAYLKETVEEVIISVPAYFNDIQRKATKRAAELAGLRLARLINEPTAAALCYGIHECGTETTFLICDLGGGTFDVSILELFEGVIEVKSVAGDNYLGGEDFTEILINHFLETNGIDKQSLSLKELSAIYKQSEACKIALGRYEKVKISIQLGNDSIETNIGRSDFENLTEKLLCRLRNPIERALRDASLHPEDIDKIILVGGSTRMPVVKTTIGKIFQQFPYTNINPEEAIVLGTAIQSALMDRNEALNEVILTDVCPYTLGTNISRHRENNSYDSGYFLPIIERNTPIPVSKVERLCTIRDNQKEVNIDVYQGENRRVEDNIKLGELKINIPPAPAGTHTIEVRYTYDINGILEVEVVVESIGLKKSLIIKNSPGIMSDDEIQERLKILEAIKIHPRDRMEYRLLLARGECLYQESLGKKRKYLDYILQQFDYILAQQNETEIKKAAEVLKECLDEFENNLDDYI